jgi:DNA ligase (NAD+)
MAYKFKSEQVSTKLNSITYQVGRTGITPVANLDPVQLAGTSEKSFYIMQTKSKKLDVRVGICRKESIL